MKTRPLNPAWLFGLKFAGLIATYYTLVLFPVFDRWLYAYLRLNAWIAHLALNAFGQETVVNAVTIRSQAYAISVKRGCDAVEPAWFFCAAVIAFPLPFRHKLPGLFIGSAVILFVNLIRIVSLYYIGLSAPHFFSTAHVEVWPVVFILLALGLCLGWIRWASARNTPPTHAVQP